MRLIRIWKPSVTIRWHPDTFIHVNEKEVQKKWKINKHTDIVLANPLIKINPKKSLGANPSAITSSRDGDPCQSRLITSTNLSSEPNLPTTDISDLLSSLMLNDISRALLQNKKQGRVSRVVMSCHWCHGDPYAHYSIEYWTSSECTLNQALIYLCSHRQCGQINIFLSFQQGYWSQNF